MRWSDSDQLVEFDGGGRRDAHSVLARCRLQIAQACQMRADAEAQVRESKALMEAALRSRSARPGLPGDGFDSLDGRG
jgi:hypothetical protein